MFVLVAVLIAIYCITDGRKRQEEQEKGKEKEKEKEKGEHKVRPYGAGRQNSEAGCAGVS